MPDPQDPRTRRRNAEKELMRLGVKAYTAQAVVQRLPGYLAHALYIQLRTHECGDLPDSIEVTLPPLGGSQN